METEFVEVKTAELTGATLDWAVGKALGWVCYPDGSIEQGEIWHLDPVRAPFGRVMRVSAFKPSTKWAQGGPLLDNYCTALNQGENGWWSHAGDRLGEGETALIAFCRAFAASKLGDVVQVPPIWSLHSGGAV